jgi:hypothetical protein
VGEANVPEGMGVEALRILLPRPWRT